MIGTKKRFVCRCGDVYSHVSYKEYSGQIVTITGTNTFEDGTVIGYYIQAEDGWKALAWADELENI